MAMGLRQTAWVRTITACQPSKWTAWYFTRLATGIVIGPVGWRSFTEVITNVV